MIVARLRQTQLGLSSEGFFWACLLLVTLAEAITALVNISLGLTLHALLLMGLALYAVRAEPDARRLALGLMLAPLIRLLSLALPLTRFPQMTWYTIVALPLLTATWMIIRQTQVARPALGLQPGAVALELALMVVGLGLGTLEYLILRPTTVVPALDGLHFWLPALSLVVFTGFTEELIFRGLLQTLSLPVLGRRALVYVSLLFAVLHIGHLSAVDVVFVFLVGLLFARIVACGGSILGVALAHGLTNVTLFLTMPYLAEQLPGTERMVAPYLIWAGGMALLVAFGILRWRAQGAQPPPARATLAGLHQRRRALSLGYTDLARLSGLSARQVAAAELGLGTLDPEHLRRLAESVGLTPEQLGQPDSHISPSS